MRTSRWRARLERHDDTALASATLELDATLDEARQKFAAHAPTVVGASATVRAWLGLRHGTSCIENNNDIHIQ
jgi:hypothetical protein